MKLNLKGNDLWRSKRILGVEKDDLNHQTKLGRFPLKPRKGF